MKTIYQPTQLSTVLIETERFLVKYIIQFTAIPNKRIGELKIYTESVVFFNK